MQPKNKILALIFGLVLPYFALTMYFVLHSLSHPQGRILPTWFPYFGMAYIFGTILLVTVVSKRLSRGSQSNLQSIAQPNPAVRKALRARAGYLILVWSGFFIYGAVETIRGKVEWQRSVPAGVFLLAFIGLFGRLLYTDIKSGNPSNNQGNSQ
jgi:hypothetical protein